MKKSEKKDQIQSAHEKKKLQRKSGILVAIYLFILILVLIGVILLMLSNYKNEISLVLIISGYIVLIVSILLITILIILKPMKNIKNKISTLEVNEILERMKEKKK